MTNLQDVKTAIAGMSPEELAELQAYIRQQALRHELEVLFADAPQEPVPAGTIDLDQLRAGAEAMWGGLDDDEIESIIAAMNAKPMSHDE